MEWNGAKNSPRPLAFVGKELHLILVDILWQIYGRHDLRYGRLAAVVGLMKSLALRKAKINAVGVVGLVENMVSEVAQRPGDIVKSLAEKQLVLNTMQRED